MESTSNRAALRLCCRCFALLSEHRADALFCSAACRVSSHRGSAVPAAPRRRVRCLRRRLAREIAAAEEVRRRQLAELTAADVRFILREAPQPSALFEWRDPDAMHLERYACNCDRCRAAAVPQKAGAQ
jgi:hypothetical protein